MSASCRSHSRSTSSDGGSPACTLASCSRSAASRCWFSCASFIAVAWYIDSSETVAIMRRVVPLILPWNSFTRFDSSSASSRPSSARALSLSDRFVTSSRTSSFSRSCSFLSFSRSSSTCSLATSSSGSGSVPSSLRQRPLLSGASRSEDSLCASCRASSSCALSSATSSSSCGIRGSLRRAASTLRASSATCSSAARISSSRFRISASPALRADCCRLDFSYKMQSSSLRSMSCSPV
mmetsp:Transcript_32217/g.95849  ORF Transcript_32217/g.95849 Transcript_32217/m.95849 type:complete len:238 (+) Transcript_32217:332-1045(+)